MVIDYRLLHGTHANYAAQRRDCVLLSLVPSWCELAGELHAHLIQHPALPTDEERDLAESSRIADLFPRYAGEPADLAVSITP